MLCLQWFMPWLWLCLLAGGKDSISHSWLWIMAAQGTKSSDKMLLHIRAVSESLSGSLSHLCPSHCPLLCLHCIVTCVWSIGRALSSISYFLRCAAELNHIRSLQKILLCMFLDRVTARHWYSALAADVWRFEGLCIHCVLLWDRFAKPWKH